MAGPPGPGFDRLALALAIDHVRFRPRQRVKLRYAITTAAAIELRVLSGRRATDSARLSVTKLRRARSAR